MEAMSLVCQLFGALVLAVNAAPYFWWGDAGSPIVKWYDQLHDQPCLCVIRDHQQLVVRPRTRLAVRSHQTNMRPLTIWNRRLEVLNMTIDPAATDFALAITHYLCDHSCVRFTICSRFQHFSVAARSQLGRRPGVTEALVLQSAVHHTITTID